jgi:protease-4
VLQLVDRAELESDEALEEGLIDQIATPSETLRELGGGTAAVKIAAADYAIPARADALHGDVGIAVIYATGTIVPGRSGKSGLGERYLGSDSLIERLGRAREDDGIAAVVLRIDSPGGAVSASDLIYRAIEELRTEKPLVVSMGSLAASGGYYIAMSADHVVSTPTTITGSIGVYLGKMEMSGLYENLGIGHELLQRGEHATLYSELRPFSDDQRAMLEERLQRFYDRFVGKVAAGRSLETEAVAELAGGRVWSGLRAVELGLADELGGLGVAIERAAGLAGVRPEQSLALHHFQPEPSFIQRFVAGLFELRADLQLSPLESSLERVLGMDGGWASWWVTLDGHPQFHLPLRILVE